MINLTREAGSDCVTAQIFGEISAADWDEVAPVLDGAIAEHGRIKLLLDAREFDGWQNLAAARGHVEFVKAHHRFVDRVAVITSRQWQHWLVAMARHFVAADLKAFEPRHMEAARAWLQSGQLRQPSVSIETADRDHVLLLRVNGEITGNDFREVLLPAISTTLDSRQRVNFIVDLTEYRGEDIDWLTAQMGTRLARGGHVGRIALVGREIWQACAERLNPELPSIEVRAYRAREWQQARSWVAE